MSMKYKNLQSFESEEKSQGIKNGPCPPQALLKRLCFGPCLLMLFLGFGLFLLVDIWIIGSKGASMRRDLETLRASFHNFTSHTAAEVQALHSQGCSLQATITSLKAVVENQEQELQAARSLNDNVFSLESKLDKEQKQLQAGYSEMLLRVQQLVKDVRTLDCQVAALRSNDSHDACCPIGWLEYEGSCYWFSSNGKSWPEAEKYCQLEGAHLVVINSREEQIFVQAHIGSSYTWMGLTDSEGAWKWVDGTNYETNLKNWKPGQPDDWQGHELGGGEDCAHFHPDGKWNDDACQRSYHWACEASISKSR